jgi:hypothetical protein
MGRIPTRRAETLTEAQTWIPVLLLCLLVPESFVRRLWAELYFSPNFITPLLIRGEELWC